MIEDLAIMKKFGVKVDLSEFFNDERKMTVILVDPEWTNVECLQKKLQNLFDLQPMHFTTEDGCYIPLQESVEVLKITSTVKGYLPNNKQKEKGSRKRTISQNMEDNTKDNNTNGTHSDSKRKKKQQKQMDLTCISPVVQSSKTKQNHIYFEEEIKENTIKPKVLIKFHCDLENLSTTQARVFRIYKVVLSKSETVIPNDNTSQVKLLEKNINNIATSDSAEDELSNKMPEIKELL